MQDRFVVRKQKPVAKVVEKKRKIHVTKTYTYRGITFLMVRHGNLLRVYSLDSDKMPKYQCSVQPENYRQAIHMLSKIATAERSLSDMTAEDVTNVGDVSEDQ